MSLIAEKQHMNKKAAMINETCMPALSLAIRILFCAVIISLITTLSASAVFAANFSITPTSIELSGGVKSGAISVINSGEEKLNCQIDVKEWGQDADGKDVYTDAKDVVFFPKIMTVGPNEQRSIRIGIKGPRSMKEKTYRIFVEEIPSQKKVPVEKSAGKITAGLTIAFRYAAPIFVKPVKQQESAIIEKTDMAKGVASVIIRNSGNIHIKLLSVNFRGKGIDGRELFSNEVAGWYILHDLSRRYEVTIPKAICKDITTIDVSAQAENITINGKLNVQRNMCNQ
jgi:fimbrial chaperone protein